MIDYPKRCHIFLAKLACLNFLSDEKRYHVIQVSAKWASVFSNVNIATSEHPLVNGFGNQLLLKRERETSR